MDAVGSPLTPDRGGDRRWSVTKESGLSASAERRCPLRGGGDSKSAKKGGAQWGHCGRQTEWSRNPRARRSSSKTEFAISPEEREVTTMNVCTAGGSQGKAAPPPLKMAEKIAFAFAAHSLPPSDIKETCLLILEKVGGRRNSN